MIRGFGYFAFPDSSVRTSPAKPANIACLLCLLVTGMIAVSCGRPDNSVANSSVERNFKFFNFHRKIIMGSSQLIKYDKLAKKTVEKFSTYSFEIIILRIDYQYWENCDTLCSPFLSIIEGLHRFFINFRVHHVKIHIGQKHSESTVCLHATVSFSDPFLSRLGRGATQKNGKFSKYTTGKYNGRFCENHPKRENQFFGTQSRFVKPRSHSRMKSCERALIANVNGYSSMRSVICHLRMTENKS